MESAQGAEAGELQLDGFTTVTMKERNHILSANHAEIIASVWKEMSEELKSELCQAVWDGIEKEHPDGVTPFPEVVRAAFCLGFHYCMVAMEQGALVKTTAGPVKVGEN